MLRTTPLHEENYSKLILTVIVQFYHRCNEKTQELVSNKASEDDRTTPQLALAAQWIQHNDLASCLSELVAVMQNGDNLDKTIDLCRQETAVELKLLAEQTVAKEELVKSTRNLATLTALYHSIVSIFNLLHGSLFHISCSSADLVLH